MYFHHTYTLYSIWDFLYYKIIKIAATKQSCSVILIELFDTESSDTFREKAVIRNT